MKSFQCPACDVLLEFYWQVCSNEKGNTSFCYKCGYAEIEEHIKEDYESHPNWEFLKELHKDDNYE